MQIKHARAQYDDGLLELQEKRKNLQQDMGK
jgi:hypothetical protein